MKKNNSKKSSIAEPMFDILIGKKRDLFGKHALLWMSMFIGSVLFAIIGISLKLDRYTIQYPVLYTIYRGLGYVAFAIILINVILIGLFKFWLSTYVVTGKARFGELFFILPNLQEPIGYEGISIIIDYTDYEHRIKSGVFGNDVKVISGVENTIRFKFPNGGETMFNFVCRKKGDITEILKMFAYLRGRHGIRVVYMEKGKEKSFDSL